MEKIAMITKTSRRTTLVARTMRSRGTLRALIQRPMNSSLRPWVSLCCGTGYLLPRKYQNQETLKLQWKKNRFFTLFVPIKQMGGQREAIAYISAESKKLMPASTAASRRRKDCGRVFCSPNVIVPDEQRMKQFVWTHSERRGGAGVEREEGDRNRAWKRWDQVQVETLKRPFLYPRLSSRSCLRAQEKRYLCQCYPNLLPST